MTAEEAGKATNQQQQPQTTAAGAAKADAGGAKPKREKKAPPPNLVIPPKKPKLTKAERRALQEKQRAAKAAATGSEKSGSSNDGTAKQGGNKQGGNNKGNNAGGSNTNNNANNAASKATKGNDKAAAAAAASKAAALAAKKERENRVELFSHLPPHRGQPSSKAIDQAKSSLHPAVVELGMRYAAGTVRGGNSRCRRMLEVFSKVLDDYVPPSDDARIDFRIHLLQEVLKPSFTYWTQHCRPHSVSMGNAFTFCKSALQALSRDMPYEEARAILKDSIEQYMNERMEFADRAIAHHALQKIEQNDILLTFGHSEAILAILEMAKKEDKEFFVWIVDARPLWEGKQLLSKLRDTGIRCGYINLNALTYVMHRVTKVFLGASALMTNGAVYGRVGMATVAMLANDHHIPVLVCCETYKISNRVQLESITFNELGDPDTLVRSPNPNIASQPAVKESDKEDTTNSASVFGSSLANMSTNNIDELKGWKDVPNLKLLHLLYDVTPSEFVSGIVTEVGIIPPTSVAVLLREMNPQDSTFEVL